VEISTSRYFQHFLLVLKEFNIDVICTKLFGFGKMFVLLQDNLFCNSILSHFNDALRFGRKRAREQIITNIHHPDVDYVC
jgi:hypothetical protein